MRRYLAYHSEQLRRVYRTVAVSSEGGPGHGPVHLLLRRADEIGFAWSSDVPPWAAL